MNLYLYLLIWCGYLTGLYFYCSRARLSLGAAATSLFVPSLVATTMGGLFVVAGGVRVAQFAGGSEVGMSMWGLWFHAWPLFLLLTSVAALGHLVWAGIVCCDRSRRRWLPVAASGAGMCTLAFLTVASHFPTA